MRLPVTRRATLVAAAALLAGGAAGATTLHTFNVSNGTGSGGATTFVQSSSAGGALQGEVATSPNTTIKVPFGMLGEYDAAGTTFGMGVAGISTTGYGVAGESLGNNPSVLGIAGGTGIGVEAISSAAGNAPAIYAESKGTGDGADIYSDSADAVAGLLVDDETAANTAKDAIKAMAANGVAVEGNAADTAVAGVAALSNLKTGLLAQSDAGDAVNAGSNLGIGVLATNIASATPSPGAPYDMYAAVEGDSQTGPGVFASSSSGAGIVAFTQGAHAAQFTASGGLSEGVDAYGTFVGVDTAKPGAGSSFPQLGVVAEGNSVGLEAYVSGNDNGSAFPIEAYNDGTEVMALDDAGNLNISGSYTQTLAKPAGQQRVQTYLPASSAPTIEDVGNAQLAGGFAAVRLDPAMAAALDRTGPYHVFVTPDGDSNGLYVASRTPSGFVVRENRGGRSNVAFEYRIVGAQSGMEDRRMTFVSASGLRAAHPNYAALARANDRPMSFTHARGLSAGDRAKLAVSLARTKRLFAHPPHVTPLAPFAPRANVAHS